MDRLARVVGVVVALLCGVVAGRVLWSPLPSDRGPDGELPAILDAPGAAIACAAAVALCVTWVLVRRRSIALTTVLAVAGLALLALPDLVRYPGDSAVLMYADAVAAGLVLGAASPLAARRVSAQAGLAAGMLGAFLLADGVESTRFWSGSEGWTAYTPYVEGESAAVLPSWLLIIVAVLVLTGSILDRSTSSSARLDSRLLLAFALLPVVTYAANWILVDTDARPVSWCVYAALVVAVVAWGAWRLPGADGRVLFAGTAIVAAVLGGATPIGTESWTLVLAAASIGAGTALGLRFPVPTVGFGVLALVAGAVLLTQEPWDIAPAIGYTFVLPAAAGYVVGSCLPTSAPATTVGLSLPFTLGIPVAVSAAWASSRYADYAPVNPFHSPETAPVGAVAVSVAVIVVCGVGAWGLDLRSGGR